MNWFASIVRMGGASFPVAASFVQLQAELNAIELATRIARLEDPISFLHEDIPDLSKAIYSKLKEVEYAHLEFDDEFYRKYRRPLAILESHGCIRGHHAMMNQYAGGLEIVDPSYVMYLCAIAEDKGKMADLLETVDKHPVGEWLDGRTIAERIDLPLPVIRAVFEIFESKGLGFSSPELGGCAYFSEA